MEQGSGWHGSGTTGYRDRGQAGQPARRQGAVGAGRGHDWGGGDPPEPELKDHLDPARPADLTQARTPAFLGGRADPSSGPANRRRPGPGTPLRPRGTHST